MRKDIKSTFLIRSSINRSFGTGFCIYQDRRGSFLLTAAHVVEACGEDALVVESLEAKVLYMADDRDTIDLALIYVENLFTSSYLKLSSVGAKEGDSFSIVGYHPHKSDYAKEPLEGVVKKIYTIESDEHKRDIYELSIDDGDSIEQGYSGSAVVLQNGFVVAIATDRKSNGKQAYATPAKYLKEIWREYPKDIFDEFIEENPYKGLHSFQYSDKENFYGREEESKEIVKMVKTTRLFTLLGASGSGKSSLIFAGIIPLLEEEGVEILTFRPLDDAFKSLASVFIPKLYPDKLEQIEQSNKLTHKLKSGEIQLDDLAKSFIKESQAKHLYLIIDQFEELFTLTKEQEERSLFLDQLLRLIDSGVEVTLFISLRADFLFCISFYEPFNHAYNDHASWILSLLSYENLKRVIEEPAKKRGVVFQEGLVERIIEEIEHESGQLPLLEFALEQFWENKKGNIISHAILDEMQSISHSISHYADKIYKSHPNYQASMEKVLIKLVNPGSGTEDTRRIASLDEFTQEARKTITLLANERLVVTKDGNVDIIHEALIREWRRLQRWVDNYREFLIWEKHLRDDRAFYLENGNKKEDLLRETKLAKAKEFLKSHKSYIAPLDREFIEKSMAYEREKRYKKISLLVVIFVMLLGTIWYILGLNGEIKEVSAQRLETLERVTHISLSIINQQDVTKSDELFEHIIKNYHDKEDIKIKEMVATAYLGKAVLAQKKCVDKKPLNLNSKECKEALNYTGLVVDKYGSYSTKIMQQRVAQALFNRATLLHDKHLYEELIERFKESEDRYIVAYVAKGYADWIKSVEDISKKVEIFNLAMEWFSHHPKTPTLMEQRKKLYVSLMWSKLLQNDAQEVLKLGEQSRKLFRDDDIEINMAHAYLSLQQEQEAMDIYHRYEENALFKKIILDDLELLKNSVIQNRDAQKVEALYQKAKE